MFTLPSSFQGIVGNRGSRGSRGQAGMQVYLRAILSFLSFFFFWIIKFWKFFKAHPVHTIRVISFPCRSVSWKNDVTWYVFPLAQKWKIINNELNCFSGGTRNTRPYRITRRAGRRFIFSSKIEWTIKCFLLNRRLYMVVIAASKLLLRPLKNVYGLN